MDFSASNPRSSNSLSLAARQNKVKLVKKLLKTNNPNCVDKRGWSCLHEAAANDSYESLLLIMKHQDCKQYLETLEGHTALYVACKQQCSLKTIKAILDTIPDIANYGSTEMVTPLHVASYYGRVELVELLIRYGAMMDVEDIRGDTPLHEAILKQRPGVVSLLLHAGANPYIRNVMDFTPFLLACLGDSLSILQSLHSFVDDHYINDVNIRNEHCLILAAKLGNARMVEYLLKHGADPHLRDIDDNLPLCVALRRGAADCFKILFEVTDRSEIPEDIVKQACVPHVFNIDIIITLFESDLGPEFFNWTVKFSNDLQYVGRDKLVYYTNAPLNNFIERSEYIYVRYRKLFEKLFHLFLMKGMSVNAMSRKECPPIVGIHFVKHTKCFDDVLRILVDHGCDVDYATCSIPDAFLISLMEGGRTIRSLLRHSLACEPLQLLHFAHKNSILQRMPNKVKSEILSAVDPLIGPVDDNFDVNKILPPLKHLARVAVREQFRLTYLPARFFAKVLDLLLCLPRPIQHYLRYI